jgi:uncharacterized protein (DUF2235 family)
MKAWHWIWRIAHSLVLLFVLAVMIGIGNYIGRPGEKGGNQSNLAGGVDQQQQKRLAVFLDGTWNSVETNTNVWRMRSLCAPSGKDGKPQLIYYSVGVNGFLGGAFGQGLDDNIRLAYEWLIENYREGDEIFIFGFSRGAYTARALAGLIAIDGLLQQGSPIGVNELFDRYKRGDEESIRDLKVKETSGGSITDQEKWLLKYSRPINIKVVGVWDTVGSIGIPAGDFTGISSRQFDYLQTGLRVPIQNGYHALAIDEHRKIFAPTIWDVNHSTAKPRPLSGVEQRWFVGAHANVGGGYETDPLAQPPLRWLMKKAESQGLTFRSEVDLDGDNVTAKFRNSYREFMDGAYQFISWRPFYRTIGDSTHRNVNETIDANVFKRWRADPTYRPQNLVEWAERKHVDPGKLQTSVRADDPNVAVPDP